MDSTYKRCSEQVIKNLTAICKAAYTGLSDIVKLTIYVTDMNDFSIVNQAMENHFEAPYPARATIEVSALPLGVNVEMDAIVNLDE